MVTRSDEQEPADDSGTLASVSRLRTLIIEERHEPGQREHVAVREVDQLQDSVDERVAERDERRSRFRA